MMPGMTLSFDDATHAALKEHLYPGDGLEAAAIIVCAKVPGSRTRFLARDVILVPYDACERRTESTLTWPGAYIERAIDLAEPESLRLVLIHSHPGGYPNFSAVDDVSDKEIMPSILEALSGPHGSAVMLPNGFVFARFYGPNLIPVAVDLVSVAGDDICFWWNNETERLGTRPVAFTSDMTNELSRLAVCVIGVSGTGSIVAEQACRLGFGRVILIDHDYVEKKNLNRILNMTAADAKFNRFKVEAFADRANQFRDDDYVVAIAKNVLSREAVIASAQCDIVFSCVDSHRGRNIADRIASAFLLPLFDVGVAIPTRTLGDARAIDEVIGRIDYIKPGGATLADRAVFTPATLQAEALAESDPDAHAAQVKAGYIEGIPEQAPSVIALNMRAASTCILEFIARAFPFRHEPNANYARTRFMLAEGIQEFHAASEFECSRSSVFASGEREPLLGIPYLAPAKRR